MLMLMLIGEILVVPGGLALPPLVDSIIRFSPLFTPRAGMVGAWNIANYATFGRTEKNQISALSGSAFAVLPTMGNRRLRRHTELTARDIFRELIEIDTTHKNGSIKAAEMLAARFLRDGWPTEDVEIIRHPGRPEKANFVARLRGPTDSGLAPVLFLAHLDVVDADPSNWETNPFQFVERTEGGADYFYGRGTQDIKNEASEMAANFLRLRREVSNPGVTSSWP
ncbi:putative peptidase M20 [Paratrimastix pyriformis]|uniref:Peptidase M20 n=1 Tax=Paratrimastix pyriformis TaxID=342808 RepID=A0ABQ8U6E3_9EUKA|nr:putative peptidase M20 [Paratrimastix pyriformis]